MAIARLTAAPTPDAAARPTGRAGEAAQYWEGGFARQPRVAYLTNSYPAISHSFIRTEIEALERLGVRVDRFTIRLGNEADAAEVARTRALLDGNRRGLMAAIARRWWRHPRRTLRALIAALRDAGRNGIEAARLVRGVAYFAEAAALADALERAGVRHIHVHFGTNPAAVARLACKLAPLTYSFTAHGPDEFDAPGPLDLRGKIADAAFAIGVSEFGRSQLMRWSESADWPRLHVVRCAVAPPFLRAEPVPQGSARRLVAVARLNAQKGLPLLVEAAARLARHHDFTLDLIGDGEQRGAIETRIAAAGLGRHVRLLGWQSPDAVRQAIESARVLVLPSFAEGLPVVLMEALALGRPVIATAVAGIPELVDAQTGWIVPAGSIDALTGAMQAALEASPQTLQAMGEAGRERVRAMHDPDRNARQLANLFKAVA